MDVRLLAISDLHVSHRRNREALTGIPPHPDDWLIVAGDVSERVEHLTATLAVLTARFARVFWVPGNHDLWCPPAAADRSRGQARYEELVGICRQAGVLTPEDAFVAAANTCIMMMFIWACERFKLDLQSYDCRAEGTKLIELDRTEIFTHLRFWPVIRITVGDEAQEVVEKRTRRALQSAQKYSLVANSVKSEVIIEPMIELVKEDR